MASEDKATGLFVTGFTVNEVLEIQAKAKEDVKAGRVITSYGNQGTSVSKQFALPVARVLSECAYALKTLDPETYGYTRSTRRVHSNFGDTTTEH